MKATLVSICPSKAATDAGRPALTPELLGASGARYSRLNDGLEAILEKIDFSDPDKSVNGIFKMIDYGHQSIADMVPVAIFIDGISIWLAYYIWSLCPTRLDLPIVACGDEDELLGGQESSTRYIRLSSDGLISPEDACINRNRQDEWNKAMAQAFDNYQKALDYWTKLSEADPSLMRIPKQLLEDPSEKAKKAVERMRRNYAFDRSRYFLPVAAKTNMMMVMPARTWAKLCQYLLSSYPMLTEHYHLGILIQQELKLASPNLDRHAVPKGYLQNFLQQEFGNLVKHSKDRVQISFDDFLSFHNTPSLPNYQISFPYDCGKEPRQAFVEDLKFHENRYAPFGQTICDTDIRFGWSSMALAEIRDLNRHRTGSKNCPPIPKGFYCAHDQIPTLGSQSDMQILSQSGWAMCQKGLDQLNQGEPSFLYWLPLGAQFSFSHRTTLDKFIYEAELRTGTGAHFRYAQHFHDLLELWYQAYPETKGLILEGSGEPE